MQKRIPSLMASIYLGQSRWLGTFSIRTTDGSIDNDSFAMHAGYFTRHQSSFAEYGYVCPPDKDKQVTLHDNPEYLEACAFEIFMATTLPHDGQRILTMKEARADISLMQKWMQTYGPPPLDVRMGRAVFDFDTMHRKRQPTLSQLLVFPDLRQDYEQRQAAQ